MADTRAIRMLVLEDDKALSEVLCDELRARGHLTVAAETLARGRELLKQSDFEVAVVDLMLPDGSGTDVLRQIQEDGLPTETIVLTGYATVSSAIEAMKLGAYDYVAKPARMEEIEILVEKAAEKARLRQENASLRVRLERRDPAPDLLTEDGGMKELLAAVSRVASSDLPVLVQGETGTGKRLLARAIHRQSPRAGQPFIAMSCAALPEVLLESELFGQEPEADAGAADRKPGLFEAADGGVLFLDEVGELPGAAQIKLLRAVESKEFSRVGGTRPVRSDVRVVSATTRDLKHGTQAGDFREDLFYRLNGVTLRVPALRERKTDITLLARHFVERYAARKKLSAAALQALARYSWPGNVRELQMVVQRASVLASGDTIEPADLPVDVRDPNWKAAAARSGLTLAEMEMEYISTVLSDNDGHRGKTARALGIDPKTLYNKLGPERPRKKA